MMSKILLSLILIQFCLNIDDLERIRADILANHNYHRKRHQVNDLVRNSEIEKVAQNYSEYLAKIDQMIHSGSQIYGENLYYCYNSAKICANGETASQRWYDEVQYYDFDNPGFSQKTGHFTQLVWKSSAQIGCGSACNSLNHCYITCNYYPPGNYLNRFDTNVFPLKEDEPDTETPDTEIPDTETPGTETPATETPVTETPDTETPGTETPATETPDTETPVTETPGTETPNTDNNGMNISKSLILYIFLVVLF